MNTIACHPAGEHIVIAGKEVTTGDKLATGYLKVEVFTSNGEFVRRIQMEEEKINWLVGIRGITVTVGGNIAVAIEDDCHICKIIVV